MTPTYRCAHCGSLNRVRAEGKTPICGRCKERLDTTGAPQEVSSEQLEELIRTAPVPVLVDFWAPWCGPCRIVAPVLDRIARDKHGALIIVKVNGDEHPEAPQRYGVRGIPTFVLFDDAKEKARQVGAVPETHFRRWLDASG